MTVDLEQQVVTDDKGLRYAFTVDPFRRECLLKGLDDIGSQPRPDTICKPFESTDAEPLRNG